jgi:hypothetical protein
MSDVVCSCVDKKLHARQEVLSLNLTNSKSGLLGFKLFFSPEDGFSTGCMA